ncbi:hypothetical protein BVY04_04360 [bacterium M21]|nr:hypothetical protein BVY04_04230 [bacterium M21]OVE81048.1 hypothetical protein BVY04_04360 [bacterium M21]
MEYYPKEYQDWLFQALHMSPGDEADPEFLEPLYYLNRQWVKTDDDAPMNYDGEDALMRAYTCYYMTINMPKLWFILDRVPILSFPANQPLRIAELGCGPGTFLWSFLFYLQAKRPELLKQEIHLVGIDRSATALKYAEKMAAVLRKQKVFSKVTFEFVEADWKSKISSPADLLIFGNVLNEGLGIEVDWKQVAADRVAIIEPGTKKGFQPLLPVRSQLVASGKHIQFPCPQETTPCPMTQDNWCHFSINRFQLSFIQRISNRAKRLNSRHNFSGFLFTSEPEVSAKNDWRVLSKLRKANRSGIRWICSGCQLKEAILSRKSRSETNRIFLNADWGDRLTITRGSDETSQCFDGRLRPTDKVLSKSF